MKRTVPVIPLLLIFWLVSSFSAWYALTYTKIWELKQLALRNRESQLSVMHPPQMDSLLALRAELQSRPGTTAILVPSNPADLALAGSPSMLRAVMYPHPVLLPAEVAGRTNQAMQILPCAVDECPCVRPPTLAPEVLFQCWEIQP